MSVVREREREIEILEQRKIKMERERQRGREKLKQRKIKIDTERQRERIQNFNVHRSFSVCCICY